MSKEIIVLIAGRLAQALLSIAVLRAMTAFLSPLEAGRYFLFISLASGFSFFLINPVGMYINRKLHSWQRGRTILDRFGVFNIYTLLSALAALAFSMLWVTLTGSGLDIPLWLFGCGVAAYLYFNTWNMTLVPALNMLGHRVAFVTLTVLTMGLGLGLAVLAVTGLRPAAFYWVSGQTAAMAVIALIGLLLIKKNTGEVFSGTRRVLAALDRPSVQGVKAFALPLAGATIFMWMQLQGYRLVVEARAGAELLGYLAIGLGIAGSLGAVMESLVQQVYYPGFYRKVSSADPAARAGAFSALTEKAFPAYIILFFFTVSLAPQLAALLVDAKFGGVVPFIIFGAFTEILRMAGNVLASAAHSEMRTRILIKPYAYGGAALLAGVYLAAGAPERETLVPLAMILGGLVTGSPDGAGEDQREAAGQDGGRVGPAAALRSFQGERRVLDFFCLYRYCRPLFCPAAVPGGLPLDCCRKARSRRRSPGRRREQGGPGL